MRRTIRTPTGRREIVVDRFCSNFRVRDSHSQDQKGTYCRTSEEVVSHIKETYGAPRHNGRDAYALEVDVVPQYRNDALHIENELTGNRNGVYPKS
ncbi:MAG: hypothetical protein HZB67_02820 [Candidatus Aenigmarchaeota archaeon]|nr:hypothetical protein [Candidatus Aenigmarchaeota archaeon]